MGNGSEEEMSLAMLILKGQAWEDLCPAIFFIASSSGPTEAQHKYQKGSIPPSPSLAELTHPILPSLVISGINLKINTDSKGWPKERRMFTLSWDKSCWKTTRWEIKRDQSMDYCCHLHKEEKAERQAIVQTNTNICKIANNDKTLVWIIKEILMKDGVVNCVNTCCGVQEHNLKKSHVWFWFGHFDSMVGT